MKNIFKKVKDDKFIVALGAGQYLSEDNKQTRGKIFAHKFKDLDTAKKAFKFWLLN